MILTYFYICYILCIVLTQSFDTPVAGYENFLGTRTPYRVVANLNDSKLQFNGKCNTEFI